MECKKGVSIISPIVSPSNFTIKYNMLLDLVSTYGINSNTGKAIYMFLYNQYKNPITKIKKDGYGDEYIQVSRDIISKSLGICIKTVIKFIQKLHAVGLIKDVRSGVNLVNKIYFRDVPSIYKLNKVEPKDSAIEDEVAENGTFKQVREIIEPIVSRKLSSKEIKEIVIKSKGKLDDVKLAVEYTLTQKYNNGYAYLLGALDRGFYRARNTGQAVKKKDKYKYDRNWDFEKLEKQNELLLALQTNEITEEEYNRASNELNMQI